MFAWLVTTEGGRFLQRTVMLPMVEGRSLQMVAGP